MGSMLKFDDERRSLVRERRQAQIERKRDRREARQRKHTQPVPEEPGWLGESEIAESATQPWPDLPSEAASDHEDPAPGGGDSRSLLDEVTDHRAHNASWRAEKHPVTASGLSPSRRDHDIADFHRRRRELARDARREARARIARAGEPAAVADALAALREPGAAPWTRELEQLEVALESARVAEIGAVARRALWATARDAARTSRRAKRDPDLALAACVAYAIVALLPRTVLRASQRTRPAPRAYPHRAFWR